MKISNSEMAKLLLPNKIKQFKEKISKGNITFDDCGLNPEKNFLQPSKMLLIGDKDELEYYCKNLCAECPFYNCAVFLIWNDMRVSFVVKFSFDVFDVFDLDEDWYCWNLISFDDSLSAYGILCETSIGEWKTITE